MVPSSLFHVDRGGWLRGEGQSMRGTEHDRVEDKRRGRVKFDERGGRGESGVDLEDRKGGSFRSIGFPDCHWEAPPFHQKKNDP